MKTLKYITLALITLVLTSGKGNGDLPAKDPTKTIPLYKNISKAQLVHMIDSLLEKDNISPKEIEELNLLAGLLKFQKKSEFIHLIDSLLEKENITPQEIDQLKILSEQFKFATPVDEGVNVDDLNNLHFYSESEENKLFPLYPINELEKEFTITLEKPESHNYSNPFNGVLTSYYGWRDKRMHKGIDIDLNKGQPVVAAFDGKVRIAKRNNGGFGNLVIIMHPNGLETVYAHLSKIKVKQGQVVLSGQVIGLGGNTGKSRGSHLHFETRYKGYALNPLLFISYNENKLYHYSVKVKVVKKDIIAYPANAEMHTIKKGESWKLISQQYNVPIRKLKELNGSLKCYYLRPGASLRVN
ncbi:MAG: peptidoglycan DD-metalloendopeptidase family protein [Sphingobacteriaceae bacterium]|nr:peptidoglycan DD-metalloendopeptidase family protein [Sphingobacteriaceae bacterium]